MSGARVRSNASDVHTAAVPLVVHHLVEVCESPEDGVTLDSALGAGFMQKPCALLKRSPSTVLALASLQQMRSSRCFEVSEASRLVKLHLVTPLTTRGASCLVASFLGPGHDQKLPQVPRIAQACGTVHNLE